jgi:PAS domain S-box-containing protein
MNVTLEHLGNLDPRGYTILVIDDNPANLQVVVDCLADYGFQVMVARDSETGLKLARQARPDLILLDVLLPGIDGFETCRRLKAGERTRQIPVIFMTILAEAESKLRGFEVGGVDYVPKPFQRQELLARVNAHLRLRELNGRLEQKVHERTAELAAAVAQARQLNQQLQRANDELVREIAERERAEEALRESEEKYRAVADFTYDWEYWLGPDANFVYVSPTCERITGYSVKEFIADPGLVEKITRPDDRAAVANHYQEVVQGSRQVHHLDFCIITRSGEQRWIGHYCQPVYGSDGSWLGQRASNRDITERKLAEQALQESEEQFRDLYENAPNAYFSVGRDGFIKRFNRRAQELLGYTAEQLAGQPVLELYAGTPQGKEKAARLFERFRAGQAIIDQELQMRRADGTLKWISLTVNAVRDSGGQVVESRSMVVDITERRQVENIMQARLRLLEFADSHSADELLTAALDEIEALTGSAIGFYHFLEPDQRTLSLQNWSTNTLKNMCTAQGKGEHYDIAQAGVWVDCIYERRPVIHNDYASLPHRKGMPEGHAPVVRELVVPIFRGDLIKAIIGVGNKATDYSESDVEIVSQLGDFSWDIAERKRAEEALRQSEQSKTILNQIASIFLTTPDDEMYTEVLTVALQALKSPFGVFGFIEVNGDLVIPSMTREIWDKCQVPDKSIVFPQDTWGNSLWGRTIKEKRALCSDGPFHMPEGHIHIDHFLTVPIIFGNETIGLISVANNEQGYAEEDVGLLETIAGYISPILNARLQRDRQEQERKRAEKELQQSNDLLRAIIEAAPTAIIGLDLDGNVHTVWNPAAEKMLGWSAQEAMGRLLPSVPVENQEEFRRFREMIRNGPSLDGVEVRRQKRDGSPIDYSIYASPLRGAEGHITGNVAVLVDITERKRAEETLRKRNEELERFEQAVIGRELKMIELKKRIAELEEKCHDQKGDCHES